MIIKLDLVSGVCFLNKYVKQNNISFIKEKQAPAKLGDDATQ